MEPGTTPSRPIHRIVDGSLLTLEINSHEYMLKYSIDDGPSPVSKEEVSNYYGVIKLSPSTENSKTHVEWSSSWQSKEEDAVEFCHGIYVAHLNELAESFKK